MIVVDGRQTGLSIQNFDNLEQLLVKVMEHDMLENRVVTDVYVNDEVFSEIYPHQAEDIGAGEISSVEIRTMHVTEMGVNIAQELAKVVMLMDKGAASVADLFRQADDGEALEMFQDLLDVTRDFFGMISVMREEFGLKDNAELNDALEELSGLFSEMIEVTENEDWILLSDLLQYEYIPSVKRWQGLVANIQKTIGSGS
jgi:hypothetical protein